MLEVTKEQVVQSLLGVGIQPGDGLLVHSAVQYLGRPAGGMDLYYRALWEVLEGKLGFRSEELGVRKKGLGALTPNSYSLTPNSYLLTFGTLAVPTFTFAFARGEDYDPQTSPSIGMGVFAEAIRQRSEALRTPHPMQSLAVIGRYAADLASRHTSGAFDPGSAFERLLELDFKLLLLGADVQAVSMLHYVEQRRQVPYRYWKDFSGLVKTAAGWETRTYRMFVRDLEQDPHIELYPVQACLQERNLWQQVRFNYGQVASCRLVDFVNVLDEFIASDPWSLVVNRS
jgi:aminoglycoside N3'-acetyltransferase